jgi:hypothetical protein
MQSVLETGMKNTEFRVMDANYAMRLILAPMVFLLLWRHSFDFCDSKHIDANRYLEQHLDMITNGLVPRSRDQNDGSQAAKVISMEKKERIR